MSPILIFLIVVLLLFAILGGVAINHFLFLILIIAIVLVAIALL